jgi:arsenate reductase
MKLRVLFLCTHNACRSQMAEALLRLRFGGTYEAFSAGTAPTAIHPLTVEVMSELGVDLSYKVPKPLETYLGQPFDIAVTMCDSAQQSCPVFPGAKKMIHRSFPDPSVVVGSDAQVLEAFRRARDQIDQWIKQTFDPRSSGTMRANPSVVR